MVRPIAEQVVVVTGASSGIGRETARAFAQQGAKVVLAARNEEALRAAAAEVERSGGQAHVVPADVADWGQVQHLADEAASRFGRIDTWVNNAGVTEYATVEATTIEEFERIIDVNLLGTVRGTKAALSHMAPQGEGVIINIASALAKRAVPLQSAYCASKHGVKGFTESLRLELARDHPGIHAVLVLPASMNTPLFAHGRSHTGAHPEPIPPVYEPAVAAPAIVHAAEHPQPEITAGGAAQLLEVAESVSPTAVDWYFSNRERVFRQQVGDRPDNGRDNLDAPLDGTGSVRGEYGDRSKARCLYTRHVELHPWRKRGLTAAAAVGTLALLRRVGR